MPDVNTAAMEGMQHIYAHTCRDIPEMPFIPLPLSRESPPMDAPIDLPTDILVDPSREPLIEWWREYFANELPSQGVTHPVSPSQPDSPAKQMRTSLTSYATPVASPLTQPPVITPGTSLPTTAPPPLDLILGLKFLPYHPDNISFIYAMYTSDNPTIVQPEDTTLLLYLAGTMPY